MALDWLKIRAKQIAETAARGAREIIVGAANEQRGPSRTLDLAELEERILLSASPAAVVVESVGASAAPDAGTFEAVDVDGTFVAPADTTSRIEGQRAGRNESFSGGAIDSPPITILPDTPGEATPDGSTELIRSTEVVFIDESAADFEQLVADLESQRDAGRSLDFFALNSEQDGVDQIAATLKRYSNLDAVHIVSHGTDGAVKLGGTWLRIGSLDGYAGTIAGWGSAIGTEGDILFYGCDLASSSRGQTLVESVAALTEADVAASTDDTGSALLGGDWELEHSVGTVETDVAFTEQLQAEWEGLLTVLYAYESFDYPVGSLEGQNGGAGWATAWNTTSGSSAVVNATGLADPTATLPVQGGTAEMNTSSIFTQSRDLTTTLGTDGTTSWFSFLVKPDGVSFGGISLEIGDGVGAKDTVTVGTNNNDFLITRNSSTIGAAYINDVLVDAQTYLLAVQIEFAAGPDTVTLYVDPTPGLSNPDSVLTTQLSTADLGTFTAVGMIGGFSGNNSNVDEIRVGETFSAVAPSGAPNTTPTASAGGPYVINEGDALALDGSASDDSDGDTLTFAWDLDNDGNYGEAGEPTTETPSVSWTTLQSFGIDDDSGGPYSIGLQVDDGNGGIATAMTTVTVNNVAPILSTTGSGTASAGSSYTLNLLATDPGADTISSWTINWGDGTIETIAGNPTSAAHAYTAEGFTFNILASAIDEDGTHFQNELLVASSATDSILRFSTDRVFLQEFATSPDAETPDYPVDTIIGPDGKLYVSGWISNDVLRYDATTGAFIDEFVAAGSNGLNSAAGLAFGPDGHLYVASRLTSEVLRFDGSTGAFIDAFVTAGSGGLDEAEGLIFGPDGDLYVSDYQNSAVYKYDGATGVFDSIFVTAGSGTLDKAEDLTFGPDGNLYVADDNGSSVLRYDGTTGAFIDDFIPSGSNGLSFATGIGFGPDGNLYVGSWGTDNVLRYDGTTGVFIDVYVDSVGNPLAATDYFVFLPSHQVSVVPIPNAPPTADTGGPYVISEGNSLNLVGSASSDPETDTLTFAWDLDNDGNYGEAGEPTTETPTVSWATLVSFGIDDDPGSPFTIGLQVDDGNGNTNAATTTLTVNNVNPTGTADGGAGFTTGEDSAFTTGSVLTNDTDPNSFDVLSVSGLDVTGTIGLVVNNNDGTFDYDPNGQFESLAQGQQTTDSFSYAVSDDDGGSSASTVTITIDGANDAPTDISLDNLSVSENSAGAVVGNLATTDIDTGDTHSYLVDDIRFEVVGSQLKLKAAQSFDFDTEPTVNITVTSTDLQGAPVDKAFVLSVTDVNDIAPVIDPAQSFDIAEDIANAAVVGTVMASDADTTGEPRQSWMITGGDPAGAFAINGATGQITIDDNSTLNFDTAPTSYALSVTTSDGTNTSAAETVTINLTDVNDLAPVIDPAQSFNVAEDIANLAVVGTVSASDADTTGEPRQNWMITGGDPAGVFAINGATGQITIADNSTLDFDSAPTSYALSVTTSDGTNTSAAETVTVNLIDVNDVAPVIDPAQSFDIAENITNLAVVGTAIASDADTTGEPRQNWMIIGGDPTGVFAINGATGQITINDNSTIDFDAAPTSYALSVTTSDGTDTSAAETVTINLTDVNDNTPVIDPDQSFNIAEDIANAAVVGTVMASDADTTGEPRQNWMITGGDPAGAFVINGATGQITIADNSTLDLDSAPTIYALSVTASDGTNTSSAEVVTINLTDVNDLAPVIDPAQSFNIAEDIANLAVVGSVTANDADTTGEPRQNWQIIGGDPAGVFAINPATGQITIADNSTLDFDTAPTSYALSVMVSDGANTSATESVSINLTNVNEAPVPADDSYSVNEGAKLMQSAAAGVLVNDSDPDFDLLSASVVNGPDHAASFVLNLDGSFIYQHDGSETTSDSFTYRAADGNGGNVVALVTLSINPQNDVPVAVSDSYVQTAEDSLTVSVMTGVLKNDTDAEATPLTSLLVSSPTNGMLAFHPDGSFVYTPDTGFIGIDSFSYQVFDGISVSAPATVTVHVSPIVAPPPDGPPGESESPLVESPPDTTSDTEPEPEIPDGEDPPPAGTADSPPDRTTKQPVDETPNDDPPIVVAQTDDDAAILPFIATTAEDSFRGAGRQVDTGDPEAVDSQSLTNVNLRSALSDSLKFADEDLSFVVQTEFLEDLQQIEQEFVFEGNIPEWAAGSAVATTAGFSVGYIVWMLRGGYMLASILSTMPMWQSIDPLPVLTGFVEDDEDDESLEMMIDRVEDESRNVEPESEINAAVRGDSA